MLGFPSPFHEIYSVTNLNFAIQNVSLKYAIHSACLVLDVIKFLSCGFPKSTLSSLPAYGTNSFTSFCTGFSLCCAFLDSEFSAGFTPFWNQIQAHICTVRSVFVCDNAPQPHLHQYSSSLYPFCSSVDHRGKVHVHVSLGFIYWTWASSILDMNFLHLALLSNSSTPFLPEVQCHPLSLVLLDTFRQFVLFFLSPPTSYQALLWS